MTDYDDDLLGPDDEPTEDELAEAAALVAALEREHDEGQVPEDALSAAHLLRFAQRGELAEESLDRGLEELLAGPLPVVDEPRSPLVRWLAPIFAGVAAAATSALAIVLSVSPDGLSAVALPTPDRGLLQAQARALGGEGVFGDAPIVAPTSAAPASPAAPATPAAQPAPGLARRAAGGAAEEADAVDEIQATEEDARAGAQVESRAVFTLPRVAQLDAATAAYRRDLLAALERETR